MSARPNELPHAPRPTGWGGWSPAGRDPDTDPEAVRSALLDTGRPVVLVQTVFGLGVADGGSLGAGGEYAVAAVLPPQPPSALGDPAFRQAHGLAYPYMAGAMANGIGSADIVEALGEAGFLGSFGAAGLSVERVTQNLDRIQAKLGGKPYAVNLIHSPNEQGHESAVADLFLSRRVPLVEASAYLDLTPHIVRYRLAGIRSEDGRAVAPNRVIAKISRAEVAGRFLSPAPEKYVRELVQAGFLTADQAEWAKRVPVAEDITVEADSGGHTDNRPAVTLLPGILALRDRLQSQFQYAVPPRVGLGGGIATPASAAAAFAMGAAYVVTGSVNQACVESGSSDIVRKMLAEAGQADVAMAPAADMFEMGVKVQVLKRGTMFPMRAAKLYELYRAHTSLEAIPTAERVSLEKTVFKTPLDEVWRQTHEFFARRDPAQLVKADADPRHKMALVFRWYLGQSSRWANAGVPDRVLDYQVWCGPAMGAFNEWAKGSYLEAPQARRVVVVAKNLLYGAALCLRRAALRGQGVMGDGYFPAGPVDTDELDRRMC